MTNVAIVGYGYAARVFHAPLVRLARGLDLYAISTRDPERQAAARDAFPDLKIYGSLTELLSDDAVQLIVFATPHHTHRDLAIQAMDAGRHVVVDKVMCMNAREAEDMIAARDRNDVLLSVFHNRRWDWDYLTVQDVIARGWIGTPYLFQAGIMNYRAPRGWRAVKSQSGGILYDWPAHFIDQALQLVDAPVERVWCAILDRGGWETDIGNYAKLLLHFANGVLYQIEIGNLAAVAVPRWYVVGDRGGLIKYGLDPQEAALRAGDLAGAHEDPAERARVFTVHDATIAERTVESVRGSWASYYQNIADVLDHGAALAVTPAQVYQVMRVYDAAMLSAEKGQTVRLSQP
ncbi:MAG: Gfo/Idh/MocA family oxidoreductase [Anaerolineae bacterium]|nr:Gfo/Idh/MocA family oxidoreductase [Anaerolineae bacterium]